MIFEELFGMGLESGMTQLFNVLFFFVAIIGIAVYVYRSIAVMTIGRRESVDYPGLAWIPSIGPALVFRKIAKMSAWPFWFLGSFIFLFFFFGGVVWGVIGLILFLMGLIAFAVFYYIWFWKTTEARNFPAWTVLLTLIPYLGLGGIWNLVLIGILAWKKD